MKKSTLEKLDQEKLDILNHLAIVHAFQSVLRNAVPDTLEESACNAEALEELSHAEAKLMQRYQTAVLKTIKHRFPVRVYFS